MVVLKGIDKQSRCYMPNENSKLCYDIFAEMTLLYAAFEHRYLMGSVAQFR